MRKGRRFTPARLERWRRNGRGTGTGSNYIPWHQVTRDDPSSRGRSHTVPWRFKRLHHLLSDQELIAFGFATMLPDVHDLREQFPLAHGDHQQEITAYTTAPMGSAAGTATIANELGCKHPLVYGNGECAPWILSTDLLLTLGGSAARRQFLAVSVKMDDELKRKRTRELLSLERAYWLRQGHPWILITPAQYDTRVAVNVFSALPWALAPSTARAPKEINYRALMHEIVGRPMRLALLLIAAQLCIDEPEAQRVFWRAVWSGKLPLNLTRPLRPGTPLQFVSEEAFWHQNPVASRRSSWTF